MAHPGVIDSGYRGEISIFIRNHGREHIIYVGERVAQLLILPVPETCMVKVDSLTNSKRGTGKCGSSGK